MSDKEHKEIIKEVLEDDDLFREDHRHKVWVLIMALFVLSITLVYFLLGVPTFGRFLGIISAEEPEENVFSYGSVSITLDENIISYLNDNYDRQQEHESIYCLKGRIENDNYVISTLMEPEVISKSYAGVSFKPCPDDTLIMLHTHPIRDCVASETDLDTLENFKSKNDKILMAIMCDKNKVSFYG